MVILIIDVIFIMLVCCLKLSLIHGFRIQMLNVFLLGTVPVDKCTKINIFFDIPTFSEINFQFWIGNRDADAAAGRVYVMTH